jgi:putative FmdB family regulatory protein
MPLYECRCERCDLTFEVLAPLSARTKARPCPECGRSSQRVLSAATLARGGSSRAGASGELARHSDVTKLTLPPHERLCWMDDHSASRIAAYRRGRGAEYDDTVAARDELQKKRAEPPAKAGHENHSHSPLADPAVFARRREAAARKVKIAESKQIKPPPSSPTSNA